MFKFTKQLFTIDKHPKKGLLAMEWVMVAYLLLTLLIVFFTYTKAENPNEMIWGRIRIAAMTAGMWFHNIPNIAVQRRANFYQ